MMTMSRLPWQFLRRRLSPAEAMHREKLERQSTISRLRLTS